MVATALTNRRSSANSSIYIPSTGNFPFFIGKKRAAFPVSRPRIIQVGAAKVNRLQLDAVLTDYSE